MNTHICSISDVKLLINYNKLQLQIQNHHVQHHILSSVDIRTSLVILHLCDIPHLTPHPPEKETKIRFKYVLRKQQRVFTWVLLNSCYKSCTKLLQGGQSLAAVSNKSSLLLATLDL